MIRSISITDLTELGLSVSEAKVLLSGVESLPKCPAQEQWKWLTDEYLTSEMPFAVHRFLFDLVYSDWDEAKGPRPAWIPDPELWKSSNIGRMMTELGIDSYRDFHRWSTSERDSFWEKMIERLGIRFRTSFREIREPTSALEAAVWLPGARLNIAESCFHKSGDAPAVIYQNPGESIARISHSELDSLSGKVANGLIEAGYAPEIRSRLFCR